MTNNISNRQQSISVTEGQYLANHPLWDSWVATNPSGEDLDEYKSRVAQYDARERREAELRAAGFVELLDKIIDKQVKKCYNK